MVRYKIAGHTMGTPEYTVPEALELFHKIDLDGAEIVVQDGYKCGIPTNCAEEELEKIRKKAEETGIKIIALTPYNSYFNSLDEEVRQKELQGIRRVIKYAKYLDAKYIRIYAGNYAASEMDPDGCKKETLISSMRELGEDAKEAGVMLVMENHFNTMTVSARQSMDIAEDVNHPNVGILYDQANLTFTLQEDYEEAIGIQMKRVKYVHVKDLDFKSGSHAFISDEVSHPKEEDRNVVTRIVGKGCIKWPEILQKMHDFGYDGWLSLEYERRWHPDDIPDASIGMKASVDYLRECFEKLVE
ncbi:MAG: sugar phosphate isomerase/epimerase [Lachnospiraceae bacterium]|nr:sugar phosphate isomerase/epimerase [Lachnospiraceae bacterium]